MPPVLLFIAILETMLSPAYTFGHHYLYLLCFYTMFCHDWPYLGTLTSLHCKSEHISLSLVHLGTLPSLCCQFEHNVSKLDFTTNSNILLPQLYIRALAFLFAANLGPMFPHESWSFPCLPMLVHWCVPRAGPPPSDTQTCTTLCIKTQLFLGCHNPSQDALVATFTQATLAFIEYLSYNIHGMWGR